MVLTDAEATAAGEAAKAAGTALVVAAGAGGWLARTVGTIPEDILGIAGGDWLHQTRRRNLAKMEAKTAKSLDGIDATRRTEASPSVVLPLLEAAADESREELQALWAALLANACLDGGKRVRRAFFDALRHMDPVDALVLDLNIRRPNGHTSDSGAQQHDSQWIVDQLSKSGFGQHDFSISIEVLQSLNCLARIRSTILYPVTPFGMALSEACTVR